MQRRRPAPARPRARGTKGWRHRSPSGVKPVPVVIAGFGRTGGALALALHRAKWPVSVFPRSGESLRRAASYGLTIAEHEHLREAGLCILAVPEASVLGVARTLRGDLGPGTALIHCAGALDLQSFGSDPETFRRARGSFHPLCSISHPEDPLAGHSVALSASTRPLMDVLRRMADDLEMAPLEVPEATRGIYHAGAVLASGGATALVDAAVACLVEAGVDKASALPALLPLFRSALRGIEARGTAGALTGPVVRGDLQVVERHLAALPRELREVYRLLSQRMLSLVGSRLPPETRIGLERVLEK